MSEERHADSTIEQQRSIHFSRVISLPWAIALGTIATVGLGVYAILGEFARTANHHTAGSYLLALVIALPMVMTYAERALVLPGIRGPYSLARASNQIWQRYFVGWTLLGGYALVTALFAVGAGLYGAFLWTAFFEQPSLPQAWFAVAALLVGLFYGYGADTSTWRVRVGLIYLALGIVLVAVLNGFLHATDSPFDVELFDIGHPLNLVQTAALMAVGYWGIFFILDVRTRMQRPVKTLARAVGGALLLGYLLGACAALALTVLGAYLRHPSIPLIDLAAAGTDFVGLLPLMVAVSGIGIGVLGINRSMTAGADLLVDMVADGFVPDRFGLVDGDGNPAARTPALGMVMATLLVIVIPGRDLAVLAATFFFLITAMIHVTDFLSRKPNLPLRRRLNLPYHPLFPGLVTILSLLMTTNFGIDAWAGTGGWLFLGLLVYLGYSRAFGLAKRRTVVVVEEEHFSIPAGDPHAYRVLVAVAEPKQAAALVELGRRLAATRDGEVLVAKILETGDTVHAVAKQQNARDEWRYLTAMLGGFEDHATPIHPMVRIAPDAVTGILETVQEEAVDLLLVGGKELTGSNRHRGAVLNPLLRYAQCDVVVLHGIPEKENGRVVVASGGGPDAALGFKLVDQLYADPEHTIAVMTVAANVGDESQNEAIAEERLQPILTLPRAGGAELAGETAHAESIPAGVAKCCHEEALLVVGASRGGVAEWPIYGGLAMDIMQAVQRPTLLVRADERRKYAALQRTLDGIVATLPTLDEARRDDVIDDMRDAAVPTVDFFVLIFLAAVIATLGLLQNSAAVIIGAMLVAPLMSPILAIAMGMVIGEGTVVRMAVESTVKGAVLAVVVGVVITVFSPINLETSEIAARTQPNILDLTVALASGAAAGYALSRKQVAAALPGVAIAAALVPPLCVVGYSLGISAFGYASGALLLFVTNLVAIVFSAALVFLALGFHPPRASRGEFLRTLRLTVLSLGAVLLVLAVTTLVTVRDANRSSRVAAVFAKPIYAQLGTLVDFTFGREGRMTLIEADFVRLRGAQLKPDQIDKLQEDLEDAVGGSVWLEATILESLKSDLEVQRAVSLIGDSLGAFVGEHDGRITDFMLDKRNNGYHVTAEVQLFGDAVVTETAVAALLAELSAELDAPVTADLHLLTVTRFRVDPATGNQ